MNQRITAQKGFTLIELLVVISIILLLGTFGISKFVAARRDAQLTTSKDRLSQIFVHLQRYEDKKGRLPGKEADGSILSGPAFVCSIWGPPIMPDKSKNEAGIFFCASLPTPPLTEENLDDWVTPETIHWAGLNQEDKAYSKGRTSAKGASKTIIACNKPLVDGEMPHNGQNLAVVYLSGQTGEITREDFGADWGEEEPLIIGPESPVEALQGLQGDE